MLGVPTCGASVCWPSLWCSAPPLAALMRELSMLLVLEVATVLAHKAPTWHMLNVSTLLMREL